MNLEIVFKDKEEDRFWSLWDECANLVKAGPKFTRLNIEYGLEYSKDKGYFLKDCSFACVRDGKPIAAVFVPLEKIGGDIQISWCGGFVFGPLFADISIEKNVFALIDEIAKENKATKSMLELDPLSGELRNRLQKRGYLDASILCYAIDLSEQNLLNACRHGHRYDINRFAKDPEVKLFCVDKNTENSRERHEEYRELHRKCSGRATRSRETFDKQYEQLKNGEAVLCGVEYKGKNIAYSYFTFANASALYFSGADDPDFAGLPLYHSMVFTGMQYLKAAGISRLDVGQPASPSAQYLYYPDEKQLNIALFKRGFGGSFLPYYRGVKYYSVASFLRDQAEFAEKYALMIKISEL